MLGYNESPGAGQPRDPDKFRDCIGDVARHLLGPTNKKLSKMHELRFNARGSISVDLRKGTWFDHETGEGGGTLDLVMRELKCTKAEAAAWLEDKGFISSSLRYHDDSDQPERRKSGGPTGTPTEKYPYIKDAELIFYVQRYENPKDFRPHLPSGKMALPPDDRLILYRLKQITDAPIGVPIIICEGEKDVHTAEGLGLVATTNQGGCGGKWLPQYSETLRGRDVILTPDNDPQAKNPKTGELLFHPDGRPKYAGLDRAERIAAALAGIAKRVRILKLWESWKECPPKGDLTKWVEAGHTREDFDALVKDLPDAEDTNLPGQQWDGDEDQDLNITWTIHELIPEVGVGLLAGQWGLYKTSVAIDMSLAIAHSAVFLGHGVRRNGGTVFFATEGAAGIKRRVRAVQSIKHKSVERSPFTWFKTCPSLLTKEGIDELIATIKRVRAQLKRRFNLPLALVIIDTVVNAAAYGKAGDENDAAVNAALMVNLARVSRETGAFVLGVDHFGKAVDTGTRGSSAKEGGADVVLALLGDRTPGGAVSKTRMALRKIRDSRSGDEHPFEVEEITVGHDEVGMPITGLVIKWIERRQPQDTTSRAEERWHTKNLKTLRAALMKALGGPEAVEHKPHDAATPVTAVDLDVVREQFIAIKAITGKSRHSLNTMFGTNLELARDRGLVGEHHEGGRILLWLELEAPRSVSGDGAGDDE
jgi:hypothetical protein